MWLCGYGYWYDHEKYVISKVSRVIIWLRCCYVSQTRLDMIALVDTRDRVVTLYRVKDWVCWSCPLTDCKWTDELKTSVYNSETSIVKSSKDNDIQGQELCTVDIYVSCTDSTRLKWIDIQYGTSWLTSARCELCISYSGERYRDVRYEWYHCPIESKLYYSSWPEDRCYQRLSWYKFRFTRTKIRKYVSSVMKVISQRFDSRFKCAWRDYLLIVAYLMHVILLWIQSINWPLHG